MGLEWAVLGPILAKAAIGGGVAAASSAAAAKLAGGSEKNNTATSASAQQSLQNFNNAQAYTPIIDRRYNPAPQGYRPGIDPEHKFFTDVVTGYKPMIQGMAAGGPVVTDEEIGQQIVADAADALRGKGRDPQGAINDFVNYFGMEEYLDFRQKVIGQGGMSNEARQPGLVSGPGGGLDDQVPARSPSRDILLSDGEFVVPADVVSGLGDGSTAAGAKRIEQMMDEVRQKRTGKRAQPKKVGGEVLP